MDNKQGKPWINPQNIHKTNQNYKEPILCTAGSNYFVVKRTGEIHKCFHDMQPIGDMLQYPFCLSKIATPCRVGYICDASSDQMFTKQWNIPENTNNKQYDKNPVCTNWKESNNPNNIKLNYNYIIIYPTEGCNFTCPYCCNYYPAKEDDPRPHFPGERSTEDWFKFFDLLKKHCNNIQMNFNGGEPLLRKDISELINKTMENNFYCSMVTNFSVPNRLDKILNIDHKNYQNFSFSVTLHPVNKKYNFDNALKYIKLFKEKGYKIRVSILGWKDNIKHYEEYKSIFKELNIPFWLKWCGGYKYDKEFIDYLHKEGATRTTAEYLHLLKWEGIVEENKKFMTL